MEDFRKAHGSVQVYEMSKSINLNDYLPEENDDILTLSAGSLTILKSIASSKSKQKYYIQEISSVRIARFMLLLELTNQEMDIGLQERAELFLEIYSNIHIRENSMAWIKQTAKALIRLVTNQTGSLALVLSFKSLKFRERDDLEFVFKFWMDDFKVWDASALWDYRSRSLLGRRFDSRENIFDWDYNMKLLECPLAAIIHPLEYKKYRSTGSPFELRNAKMDVSNKTMATVDYFLQDGVKVAKYGLFSDILTGPFIGCGIDTNEKQMLEKRNDKYQYTSQSIQEFNIKQIMEGFRGSKTIQQDDTLVDLPLDLVAVEFLPCDLDLTLKKAKYNQKFGLIYISFDLSHRVADVYHILKEGGRILVEDCEYNLGLSKEQKVAYRENVEKLALKAGLKVCRGADLVPTTALVFVK